MANELRDCRNDIAHGYAVLSGVANTAAIEQGAPLKPVVARRRSERNMPRLGEADVRSLEQLRAKVQREWFHDLPTIRKWTEITVQLQIAARRLAEKLGRHRRGEDWESVVVPRLEMPVRTKKGE